MSRRKYYRASEGLEGLRIVVEAGPRMVETTILNASAGGAALRAPIEFVAQIAKGQSLNLRFVIRKNESQFIRFAMPAVARHIDADDGFLGVEFKDSARLEENLPSHLFRLFNRRRSFRVRADTNQPIDVSLTREADGFTLATVLHDICADGIGARCSGPEGMKFATDDRVTTEFSLPVTRHPLKFVCSVRAVSERKEGYVVGLAFLEESERFSRNQNAVIDFVMQRQRELLRAGN